MRPIDLNKIKTGSLVIITNTKNCIEGFENINEKEPVDVIFVNKKYYINSLGVLKHIKRRPLRTVFHQNGHYVCFGGLNALKCIVKVIKY